MPNNSRRLEQFAYDVISLISHGEQETISTITEKMYEGTVVRFICERYHANMNITYSDNSPFDLQGWEDEFSNIIGWASGEASRKFGVIHEEQGLLFLLGVTLAIIQER